MTQLQTLVANSGTVAQIGENFEATSAAGMYGRRAPAVVGLTWAYYGGRGFGNTIADGTVALTASTTNYVVASRSTGAVSVSTALTNWNDSTNYYRLYLIVTGAATITTATDYREFTGGAAGGPGMSNPMTTAGDIIYGGTPSGGIAPPTRLAATTNGYVLTLAAGVPTWAAATGGFSNPMTSVGDLIVGGTSGAPARLAAGASTYVLTSNGAGAAPSWQAASSGFANPMTTTGDIIYSSSGSTPARLAAGTNGYVLTLAGGVPTWAAAAGGSVTGFTSSLITSAPNSGVNVSQLLASGGSTNQNVALTPAGTGGLMAQVPDNTGTGGNNRGANCVDWQTSRSLAAQVASAAYSAIGGGLGNTANGAYTNVTGGRLNTATGQHSIVTGGWLNAVTGTESIITGGRDNASSGTNCRVGGASGSDRGITAADVFGLAAGFQRGHYHLQRNTTNSTTATATAVYNAAASASNTLTLNNNSAAQFSGMIVAKQASSTDAKCWKFEGLIVRGASAGTTILTAAVTPTVVAAATGAAAWTVAISADTTLGGLKVDVTGEAAKNIAWNVVIDTSEVA